MTTNPRAKKQKWNNKIPDWLNTLLAATLFLFLVAAAIMFLSDFHSTGVKNYETFYPSAIIGIAYFVILFIASLFSTDMANIMMVTLLIAGFIVLGIGFYSKEKDDKTTSFEFAAAILGLALGIPFGERLRKSPAQVKNLTTK
jgi:peptidoglycan/LPS O-acetylase OafA/YrhL